MEQRSRKVKFVLALLLIVSFFLISCSNHTQNSVAGTFSPSPTHTAHPDEPGQSPESSVSGSVQTPSSTDKLLYFLEIRLHVNFDSQVLPFQGPEVEYAGEATLSIKFTKQLVQEPDPHPSLVDFVRVNGEPLDEAHLFSDGVGLVIMLSDDLPENVHVEVLPGLTIGERTLESGFSQKLKHYEGLKCIISPYSLKQNRELLRAVNLIGSTQTLKVSFSKPVDPSNIQINCTGDDQCKTKLEWLNDKECLVYLSNLTIWKRYTVSVQDARKSSSMIFGSGIDPIQREDNYPEYQFYMRERQRLQAINLNAGTSRTIREFEQGMLAEQISPNHDKLAMGIITNETEGYHYTKCILDLLSDNPKLVITAHNDLYNPLLGENYWTGHGEYKSDFVAELLSTKTELTQEFLPYIKGNQGRWMGDTLHLKNGEIAMIQGKGYDSDLGQQMFLVHGTIEGKIINEYPLPFKWKTGEGWLQYLCGIEEIGKNTLWVTGYEKIPYGPVSTYSLSLIDGNMTLIAQTGGIMKLFPQYDFGVFYQIDSQRFPNSQTIDFIDYSGKTIKTLKSSEGFHFEYAFLNPKDGKIYLFQNSSNSLQLSWIAVNPKTFETKRGTLTLDQSGQPFGFLKSGELLVLDRII